MAGSGLEIGGKPSLTIFNPLEQFSSKEEGKIETLLCLQRYYVLFVGSICVY
jgi:hypothetical protein